MGVNSKNLPQNEYEMTKKVDKTGVLALLRVAAASKFHPQKPTISAAICKKQKPMRQRT